MAEPDETATQDADIKSLIRRTMALEKAAGEMGDSFLRYLYGMAVLHLEGGVGHTLDKHQESLPAKDRRQIEKLAKLLATQAKREVD